MKCLFPNYQQITYVESRLNIDCAMRELRMVYICNKLRGTACLVLGSGSVHIFIAFAI